MAFGVPVGLATAGLHEPDRVQEAAANATGDAAETITVSGAAAPALIDASAEERPLVSSGAGILAAQAPDEPNPQDLADTLAPWRAALPGVAVHERLLEGSAEPVVTRETAGAAQVVVGSRGRGALAGLLLGSTSQALVRDAECPVVVVRPLDR